MNEYCVQVDMPQKIPANVLFGEDGNRSVQAHFLVLAARSAGAAVQLVLRDPELRGLPARVVPKLG